MRSTRPFAIALLCAMAASCDPAPTNTSTPVASAPAAPSLVRGNLPVAATVDQGLTYDATQGETAFSGPTTFATKLALTYRVTFEGTTNGLSAIGGTISGRPLAPAVTWATITATDSLGRSASDRFPIVAFAPGLAPLTLPATPFAYTDAANPLPQHFRTVISGSSVVSTDNTPADNPVTDAGAALGRVLFYDMRLSASDGLSCAGCHSQFIAFGDTPPRSIGFAGGFTGRHTPALTNARFYRRGHFFWDERAATLEDQVLGPIQNAVEMGMTLENLVAKIGATPYYPSLFVSAFGTSTVTSDRVARALAQYVRSLVSTASKYDRSLSGGATLTAQEQQGEALFRTTGCASCHTTVSQVSDSVHNIGLDAVDTDVGAGRGAFKAPSLRNVAVRAPYMHDGRFATLDDVVEFFNSRVQPSPNLDPRLQNANGTPKRLGLTGDQKTALIAFLNTLTDSTFLTAARFSNPFAPPGVIPPPLPPPTVPPPTTGPTPPVSPAAPATGAVSIQANSFRPASITVARGAVVAWTNFDNSRHGVGFLTAGPANTPIFSSGTQQVAMPAVAGTYNYQCLVHGAAMRGTIVVQ